MEIVLESSKPHNSYTFFVYAVRVRAANLHSSVPDAVELFCNHILAFLIQRFFLFFHFQRFYKKKLLTLFL